MKYLKYFEAKLRDVLLTTNDILIDKINKNFDNDAQLIFVVFIKKYNKNIFLKWNNSENHSIIERIKNRTSFKSISEFNDFIDKGLNKFFEDHFNDIDKDGIYALYFIQNEFYLLLNIIYNNLFHQYTILNIPTITISSPKCYKILHIIDDF